MASPIGQIVGATIKDLREKQKLSQTVLADLSGIGRVHLARIESGSRTPSLTSIVRIAVALRVAPAELLKKLTLSAARNLTT